MNANNSTRSIGRCSVQRRLGCGLLVALLVTGAFARPSGAEPGVLFRASGPGAGALATSYHCGSYTFNRVPGSDTYQSTAGEVAGDTVSCGSTLRFISTALASSGATSSKRAAGSPRAAGLSVTDLNSGLSADDLAAQLVGAGVTVSNVTVSGAAAAAGRFTGGSSILGFERGIILGSGAVVDVVGPNNSDNTTSGFGSPGDADLNGLIPGFATNDAAVLEFDFIPAGGFITFRYVFASEEYNEYANTSFNDVFGLFVNGSNRALLPDGVTPVSINNVNGGNNSSAPVNPSFYRNNDCSDLPCPHIDIEADGLTVVLTLTAAVNAGVSNHLKLAIADAGDSSFDSWVFIEAESLTLSEDCVNGVDDDGDGLIDHDDPDCFICGDGVVDPGEGCDDGNLIDCDGCNSNCTVPSCGDGIVCAPEECDPSAQSGTCGANEICSGACTCACSESSDCDDGDVCNGSESCDASGSCQRGIALVCDDGDVCNGVESCNAQSGCLAGITPDPLPPSCTPECTTDSDCDDGNGCTDDACSGGSCGHANNTAACDDGNLCTEGDSCGNGVCSGTPSTPASCDDGNDCTDDGCDPQANDGAGSCVNTANAAPCDDGLFCTDDDVCSGGSCQPGGARDCGGSSVCAAHVCDEELDMCISTDDPEQDGQPCDDGNACTQATVCSAGLCSGGSVVDCNDSNACTSDSCDTVLGCQNPITVESPDCNSCDDGIDNDSDGNADAEEIDAGVCICSTLCRQHRFAATVTHPSSTATRFSAYTGSNVSVASVEGSAAGACVTGAAVRAGGRFGLFAVTGGVDFGQGAVLGSDAVRGIDIRSELASDGGPERSRSVAPLVGPGACSDEPTRACVANSDCAPGSTCVGRMRLSDPGNPFVDRSGTADNFLRCVDALAAVAAEGAGLAGLAGNVPGYGPGDRGQIKTTGGSPLLTIHVGSGQRVIEASQVILAGKTKLQLVGDSSTTLLIRVAHQLRLGGNAEVELLGGLSADRVLWNVEGNRGGGPKLQRGARFRGTLLAAQRRGVVLGGDVTVDGAIEAARLHIGRNSTINHMPFSALLQ